MKANVLFAINDLRWVDVPDPVLKKGEVLVKVMSSGICGSDVNRVFKTGTYHFPTVIGHEFSGIVTEAKDAENNNWVGKRVGVFPLKPCKKCPACLEGKYEMCDHYDYLGSRCDGGFAQYVAVPVWNLIELPKLISFEEAAMLEPTAVAFHALKRSKEIRGKTVAIIGPGTIGNILVQVARIKGAAKVVMVGRTFEKLKYSENCGADTTFNSNDDDWLDKAVPASGGLGFDIVVEGTGAPASLENAIRLARPEGTIVLMGNPLGDMQLSKNVYWRILRKQLNLIGTWNSSFANDSDDWKEALQAMQSGSLNVGKLITHRLKFNQLIEGLDLMRNPNVFTNKVMLYNE